MFGCRNLHRRRSIPPEKMKVCRKLFGRRSNREGEGTVKRKEREAFVK
jgi:hypothetical protein